MRVLYLSAFDSKTGGGAGRVAFEMVKVARDCGIDSGILYPAERTEMFVKDGVTHITIQSIWDKDAAFLKVTLGDYLKISKLISNFNPDLVHSHNEIMAGMIGAVWAIVHSKPLVLTVHMMPTKIREWDVVGTDAAQFVKFMHKLGVSEAVLMDYYKNCDALIALNDSVYTSIVDFGYKGDIWKIPNGRNLSNFLQLPVSNLESGQVRLVFAGNLSARKNQKFLVEAMKYLPSNFKLTLIGEWTDVQEIKIIEKIIKENNLTNIDIKGIVPFDSIPGILANADVFVSASKAEVQSLSVMEALAAGKPIVGLYNETIREFVDSSNGFCLPTDTSPDEFAQKILEVVQNKDKYKILAVNSRNKIRSFDWSDIMDRTIVKYKELVYSPKQNREGKSIEKLIKLFPVSIQKHLEEIVCRLNNGRNQQNRKKLPISTIAIMGASLVGSVALYTIFNNFRKKKKNTRT